MYEPDGTYQREKGYGFLKQFGRDFCKYGHGSHWCRPSDPHFFKSMYKVPNGGEPFWGHPPSTVLRDHEHYPDDEPSMFPNWVR